MRPILTLIKDRNGREMDRNVCINPDHYVDAFQFTLVGTVDTEKIKHILQQFYEVVSITDEMDGQVHLVIRHMNTHFSALGFVEMFKTFFPCHTSTYLRHEVFSR